MTGLQIEAGAAVDRLAVVLGVGATFIYPAVEDSAQRRELFRRDRILGNNHTVAPEGIDLLG
ncbi:MAG: Uncharacterised protein [Rhodospirillaceae bacterium]|nr:MAG: Uncharacterised protein [Rhodospirillaceae bacterium]